jgi:hypothetical protein
MGRAARRCSPDANIGAEPARPVIAEEGSGTAADRATDVAAGRVAAAGTTGAPDAADVTVEDGPRTNADDPFVE